MRLVTMSNLTWPVNAIILLKSSGVLSTELM